MMIGHLNADISFCELDGRLFFLDIRRDRYFQLSGPLESSFRNHLKSPGDGTIDVRELAKRNLLSSAPTRVWPPTGPDIAPPSHSVLEMRCSDLRVPTSVIRDVFIIVCVMRWQLKTRRLKSILQDLNAYRRIHTVTGPETGHQQGLLEAVIGFNRVRPYVPIETCCLIDSLSMVRFLAKRGMHSQLIMGVTCDPFSAHAWVQHGLLVLNETVGTVQSHVPIRVI